MAISLSFSGQDHIGPGYAYTYIISAGPIPVDDYVAITVQVPGHSNFVGAGIKVTHGFLVGSVVIGVAEVSAIANGPEPHVGYGTAVDLVVTQYHANGVSVASQSYPAGSLWDPTDRLYRLLEGSPTAATLNKILAAVSRTYPPS